MEKNQDSIEEFIRAINPIFLQRKAIVLSFIHIYRVKNEVELIYWMGFIILFKVLVEKTCILIAKLIPILKKRVAKLIWINILCHTSLSFFFLRLLFIPVKWDEIRRDLIDINGNHSNSFIILHQSHVSFLKTCFVALVPFYLSAWGSLTVFNLFFTSSFFWGKFLYITLSMILVITVGPSWSEIANIFAIISLRPMNFIKQGIILGIVLTLSIIYSDILFSEFELYQNVFELGFIIISCWILDSITNILINLFVIPIIHRASHKKSQLNYASKNMLKDSEISLIDLDF